MRGFERERFGDWVDEHLAPDPLESLLSQQPVMSLKQEDARSADLGDFPAADAHLADFTEHPRPGRVIGCVNGPDF